MKEIVIISGKGGTGKTSIVGAFAALAEKPVLADCDVDAADLYLILQPTVQETHEFSGGKQARIIEDKCVACGKCKSVCRFDAINVCTQNNRSHFSVNPTGCEGCGVCAWFCPVDAIAFEDAVNGSWFESTTRFGPMVHAKLGVAEENSGKLVSVVREKAREIAEKNNHRYILVDGSPGIGCPVIASITGADLVVIVTEPTVSGEHDLDRVVELAKHFGIPAAVCVNKADINPTVSARIKNDAQARGLTFLGEIPYDKAVTDAQVAGLTVIEHAEGVLKEKCCELWQQVVAVANKK